MSGVGRGSPGALAERVLYKSVVALALCAPVALMLAPAGYALERLVDASTYYRSGQAYLAGTDPYLDHTFRQWPLVAALCAPLTLLPQHVAVVLVALATMAAGALGVVLVRRRLAADALQPPRLWVAAVAFAPPFLTLFYLGQMTGFCVAAFAAGLVLLERRPALAGLCFALMGVKPHLALLALPALLAGAPAAGIAFAAGSLVWPVGSLLVSGPSGLTDFLGQLYRVRAHNEVVVGVPLTALLPFKGEAHSALQVVGLVLTIALLAVLFVRRCRGQRLDRAGVDVATALVLAGLPYALMYDLLFVIPLFLRLGGVSDRRPWSLLIAWWALPILSLALLPYGGGGLASLLVPIGALYLARQGSSPWRAPGWLRPPFSAASYAS